MSQAHAWDPMLHRSRTSLRARYERWRSKTFHIAQCAIAAGVAYFIAKDLFGHPTPFFAPIAAVVSLGVTYGQRLRRVAEVTVGVAVGVLVADLLILGLGSGWWQLILIVSLAMSIALFLDSGHLVLIQAAVQSIVVACLVVPPDEAVLRWTDALIGGGVALVAATIVPSAALRHPREQAARVIRKVAELLRGAAAGMTDADVEKTLATLSDARATDALIQELRSAADEGLAVVVSSPFRRKHRGSIRRLAELVEPLDRSVRTTRVLVRRVAVAAYHRQAVPPSYAVLCQQLADATDLLAAEMAEPVGSIEYGSSRAALLVVGQRTSQLERTPSLSNEVVLGQMRSLVVDLLQLTGMGVLEATDALPPPAPDNPAA